MNGEHDVDSLERTLLVSSWHELSRVGELSSQRRKAVMDLAKQLTAREAMTIHQLSKVGVMLNGEAPVSGESLSGILADVEVTAVRGTRRAQLAMQEWTQAVAKFDGSSVSRGHILRAVKTLLSAGVLTKQGARRIQQSISHSTASSTASATSTLTLK